MLRQAEDLRAEIEALRPLLESLEAADWDRPTGFKRWTANDILQHLHEGDMMAAATVRDADEFRRLRVEVVARRERFGDRLAETRDRFGDLTGRALIERWHETALTLCDLLAPLDPKTRLAWIGPDMGARSFATARQMEAWAHGQALYDMKGATRADRDRIRNIAELGVRTFGWTFRNRGMEPPGPPPEVRLTAPSGAVWEWNLPEKKSGEGAPAELVAGPAVSFCQVVAQTRNVADTELRVTGPVAGAWMAIAQCFAGPPEEPPAPGARAG